MDSPFREQMRDGQSFLSPIGDCGSPIAQCDPDCYEDISVDRIVTLVER
jgi:hypothetical protein